MKHIGVFFGSGSPEHDVSIITGQLVIATLKKLGYPVTPVYITKQGHWLLGEELGSLKMFAGKNSALEEKKYRGYYLDMEESVGKMVFKKKGFAGRSMTIDLAFPALHGSYGEDGTIQGMFEMLGVPYVGCDVTSSSLAMDKALAKQMCQQHNIPTTKFIYFFKKDWDTDKENIIIKIKNELSWPVFVKPVHLGSSIGIAKVKDKDTKDLEYRIEVALQYDNKVLVEEGVNDVMDVTCCILGNQDLQASVLQESVFNSDLFDFEEKYLKEGGAQLGNAQSGLVIPARLDDATTLAIQESAKQVYSTLGCSGIARVDFLFDKQSKKFFANEVNPMPGTLYHHLWKASGVEVEEVVQKLIALAEETYEQKRQVTYTFNSSLLEQLKGSKFSLSKLK